MTKFSVQPSFSRATQESSANNNSPSNGGNSGSSGYFEPGHENTILAPYNFSFI